jgi:ribonuclease Z
MAQVYEKGGVKVIAFEVDHGDVIKPCYGYRFEYGGRVAVFSSDTRYNHNVINYGAGADLLVHEVASAQPELMKEAYIQSVRTGVLPCRHDPRPLTAF